MIDLEQLLLDYIKEQGQLVLPQLGVIRYTYQPAEVFRYTKRILPPRYKIEFFPNLIESSNETINYIAERLNLVEEDAQENLNAFINKIKEQLEVQKSYFWPQVGTFRIRDNSITFEEDKESILLAYNLGLKDVILPTYDLPTLENNKKTETSNTIPTKKLKKTVPTFVKIGICTAAFILMIFFIIVPNVSIHRIKQFQQFYSLVLDKVEGVIKIKQPSYDIEKIRQANREALSLDSLSKKKDKDTLVTSLDITVTQKNEIAHQLRYYIIAGSFKNKENAIRCLDELREKGYTPEILVFGDSLFRVYIYSSTQRQKAVEEFIGISQQDPQLKIWFYSRYE